MEPSRGDGDRPLPARRAPPRPSTTSSRGPQREELPLVGIDNLPGAVPLETAALPQRCVLLFGQEGPGLSTRGLRRLRHGVLDHAAGSTRSINAGVASGIAMHTWLRQHAV